MKTLRSLLVVIILIIVNISACKKDTTELSDIVGKWNLTHVKSSLSDSTGILDSLTINSTHEDNIDFRSNGKVYGNSWIGISFNSEHKISFTNNVQSIYTYYYKIVNDKILITNENGEKDTMKVIRLTNNQLILDWSIKIFSANIPIDYNNYILWNNQFYYTK